MKFTGILQGAVALLSFGHAVHAATTVDLAAASSKKLNVFPIPENVTKSTTFRVKARSVHGQHKSGWKDVELYQTPVHEINTTTGRAQIHQTSVALFDFSEGVELSIEPNATVFSSIDAVRVRPLSYNLNATASNGKIKLTLTKPQNLVLEVNGDVFNVIHLFLGHTSDEASQKPPPPSSLSRVYGPGYHELSEPVKIKSGETVYLAPGAVVKGGFFFQNVTNAAILGRGVITRGASIEVVSSSNIRIDGVTILNPEHYSLTLGMADNVHVSNFRSISGVQWGDGIDVFCSTNVVLEKLFMRNSDDCVALYQHRWGYIGDSKNITVKDSSLWADVAHPIHLGLHGNTETPETMEGVTISNIDILDHREAQVDYSGCIAINCGDSNLIKDVLVENTRIEDFRIGMLFNFKVFFNPKYNTSPGRGIRNVTIKDVSYNGEGEVMSLISGYDENRTIEFVDFQGFTKNGKAIWDGMAKPGWYQTADLLPMFVGSHVKNLTWSEGP